MRNWFDSAQNRNYWRALVNAALKLRLPKANELVLNHRSNRIITRILQQQGLVI